MAKLPTNWSAPDGSSTIIPASGDLLLEDGSYLLLEDGFKLVLEDVSTTPKKPTQWDDL